MTDFLSRVAARAVGANAPARPRLAGLFEPAGTADDATLEVVEGEVVAPTTAPRADDTAARAELAPPPAAPTASSGRRPDESVVAAVVPPPAERAPAPPPAGLESAHDPLPPAAPARGRPRAATPAATASRAAVVAAAPLTQALPATRVGAPSSGLSRGSAAPPRAEAPPVRVHIGRLEVRANLQPPVREQPRREAPRPEGVSLADYLRGQREVRA